jgi:hypothetical protein
VFALVAIDFYDATDDTRVDYPQVLTHVQQLPRPVLNMLAQRCTGWRTDQEHLREKAYVMNHCLRCGGKLTDHYLHAEPGSAFFPTSPDDCGNISMFTLPWQHATELECSVIVGGLTDFLEFDKAGPWDSLAAV